MCLTCWWLICLSWTWLGRPLVGGFNANSATRVAHLKFSQHRVQWMSGFLALPYQPTVCSSDRPTVNSTQGLAKLIAAQYIHKIRTGMVQFGVESEILFTSFNLCSPEDEFVCAFGLLGQEVAVEQRSWSQFVSLTHSTCDNLTTGC